jgi:hypothetical protein
MARMIYQMRRLIDQMVRMIDQMRRMIDQMRRLIDQMRRPSARARGLRRGFRPLNASAVAGGVFFSAAA